MKKAKGVEQRLTLITLGVADLKQSAAFYDVQDLISKYFNIEEIEILKGGKLSNKYPKVFARNIAFRCSNKNP